MKNVLKIFFLLLFVSSFANALQESEIKPSMEDKIKKILKVLQDKNLSDENKKQKLFEISDPLFDYVLMAKLSFGKQWKALSKEQQDQFVKAFEKNLKTSYTDKLNLYNNQKVNFGEIRKVKDTRIVLEMNIHGEKENFLVVYKFYKANNNNWLIYDVDIVGVSIIQTYKNQFNNILQTMTFDELIKKIQNNN